MGGDLGHHSLQTVFYVSDLKCSITLRNITTFTQHMTQGFPLFLVSDALPKIAYRTQSQKMPLCSPRY